MHSFRRRRLSEYGLGLREKQKAKRIYGILESQFQGYFRGAERKKGHTGQHLLAVLERRLDNVVYLAGFADSRAQARQMISHGHITVRGRKVDIPSCLVRRDDVIGVSARKKSERMVRERLEATRGEGVPAWLGVDLKRIEVRVLQLPTRDDVTIPIREQLIVELCSRG